jgi:hypothetical protein
MPWKKIPKKGPQKSPMHQVSEMLTIGFGGLSLLMLIAALWAKLSPDSDEADLVSSIYGSAALGFGVITIGLTISWRNLAADVDSVYEAGLANSSRAAVATKAMPRAPHEASVGVPIEVFILNPAVPVAMNQAEMDHAGTTVGNGGGS